MAEYDAQANQILDDLKSGKVTINDLLGTLYNKGESPDIKIPPGNKNEPSIGGEYAMGPADCEHNISAVSHVGPSDIKNPPLKEKYDLVVLGAGVAGLLSVIIGKSLGKKCLLIEKHYMGGDCLNVGCFPSKALIRCARAVHEVKNSAEFGVVLPPGEVTVDFGKIMKRMRELRAGVAPHDGVKRYTKDFCEDIVLGVARFGGPDHVLIEGNDGQKLGPVYFDKCMIATGASAAVVPVPGLKDTPHLTNGNFFNMEELPPRACLIGAGPIGIEMAQTLHRFGSKVTIFEMMPQLLPREDPDAAELVRKSLEADGVEVQYSVKLQKVEQIMPGGITKGPFGLYNITCQLSDGTTKVFECEALLNATGRVPNVFGIGLDEAGVEWDTRLGVHIDDEYRTGNPKIYSCGDCASPYKFTHAADWQARCAVRNMFLAHPMGGVSVAKHSDLLVPWCTYTEPEVAHVGLYVKELDDKGVPHDTYMRQLADVDRCKCEGIKSGFVKISCAKGTDKILGATIVGPNAGDLISEITVAMQNGIGVGSIAGVMHPYPTMAEGIRQCCAQFWQRPDFRSPATNAALAKIMDGAK